MKSLERGGQAAGPKAVFREIAKFGRGLTGKQAFAILLAVAAVSVAAGVALQPPGCAGGSCRTGGPDSVGPGAGNGGNTQLPNPAAVYCVQAGGTPGIVETPEGQAGFCDLPDGRSCDEWAFYRSGGTECVGAAGPAEQFCGTSTNGSCMNDAGCRAGGCSNHVCYSHTQQMPVTTCEWRGCYNATAYGVVCSCVNNRCSWAPR